LTGTIALVYFSGFIRRAIVATSQRNKGQATIANRVAQYGPAARARLKPYFDTADTAYPPKRIVLVGLKQERQLEVWVSGDGKKYKLLHTYPILGASGVLGPKLREGDRQVPEGLYRVELLNPNSLYHLSLRVNYPNAFDLQHAKEEGRSEPGSDIMIHGKAASIGCLAMGDPAIEEIFVLVAETGIEKVEIILSPVDFRKQTLPKAEKPLPAWTEGLYAGIRVRLAVLGK
jgi:murein L,D-transpeptidase YafK